MDYFCQRESDSAEEPGLKHSGTARTMTDDSWPLYQVYLL